MTLNQRPIAATGSSQRRRWRISCVSALFVATVLTACQASPGPAPVEEPEEPTTTEPVSTTTETASTIPGPNTINVGIDTLRNGFNPHLFADDTSFIRDLSALVLPSAFRDGEMDPDVLVSADVVEEPAAGSAQTVRYVIDPEAQWSDGTPITGTDFQYLWQSMITTAGTIDSAGYQAISSIRTSNGGKTVHVDFRVPVQQWQTLFSNLLPSHLLQPTGQPFDAVLFNEIPASAGRYMVSSIDRQRGMITLNRNDRFWGTDPAITEVLTFRNTVSTSQVGELLRTGQTSFMNLNPTETLVDTVELSGLADVNVLDTNRNLEFTFNVDSRVLAGPEHRAEVASALDIPRLARLAAGRSANLSVPEYTAPEFDGAQGTEQPGADGNAGEPVEGEQPPDQEPLDTLATLTEQRALRIVHDPADDQATAAARAAVEMLEAAGIQAVTVSSDLDTALGTLLPNGRADALITWRKQSTDPLSLAGRYLCEPDLDVDATPTPEATGDTTVSAVESPTSSTLASAPGEDTGEDTDETALDPTAAPEEGTLTQATTRGSNISGFCDSEADGFLADLITGAVSAEEGAGWASALEAAQVLSVPILGETRVEARTPGIVGASEEPSDWPGGIANAANWRKADEPDQEP